MTILSAAQSACVRLVGRAPQSLFSTQETMAVELRDLANDIAEDIMKSNDWRGLTFLHEITGDGSNIAFPLPADYDRMTIDGDVFRPDWNSWHYTPARDLNQWRDLLNGSPSVTPGFWIILAGQMQFYPIITEGDKAQFYYVSKNIVKSSVGVAKALFDSDNDEFMFGDRLMTLALVWRWRAQKRMEYAEDLASYEKALAEIMGREKGARVIASGRKTINANVGIAYPWPLGA